MIIRIHLFALARDLAKTDQIEVDLPSDATVGMLRTSLAKAIPALASLLTYSQIAIDSHYATDDEAITPGAELAVIPPVSGG